MAQPEGDVDRGPHHQRAHANKGEQPDERTRYPSTLLSLRTSIMTRKDETTQAPAKPHTGAASTGRPYQAKRERAACPQTRPMRRWRNRPYERLDTQALTGRSRDSSATSGSVD